jgi:dehydrodolichyl diphosphate syntase complex subunit NUS1
MLSDKERTAFHRNTTLDGKLLSAKERETLMKRFLPPTPSNDSPSMSPYPSRSPSQTPPHQRRKPARRKPIRTFVWTRFHQLLHVVILALFGLYIRLRQAYHAVFDRILALLFYHHRTPDWIRKDIQGLTKIPEHLSVILSLDEERLQPSGLESLLNDVGDLAAWCASAGIPMISIYERKGDIMAHLPSIFNCY